MDWNILITDLMNTVVWPIVIIAAIGSILGIIVLRRRRRVRTIEWIKADKEESEARWERFVSLL